MNNQLLKMVCMLGQKNTVVGISPNKLIKHEVGFELMIYQIRLRTPITTNMFQSIYQNNLFLY